MLHEENNLDKSGLTYVCIVILMASFTFCRFDHFLNTLNFFKDTHQCVSYFQLLLGVWKCHQGYYIKYELVFFKCLLFISFKDLMMP